MLSACMEYKDLQSDNGIANADTQRDGITNPVEQLARGSPPQPSQREGATPAHLKPIYAGGLQIRLNKVYILSLVQAPSLWEGWGGLHLKTYKIWTTTTLMTIGQPAMTPTRV